MHDCNIPYIQKKNTRIRVTDFTDISVHLSFALCLVEEFMFLTFIANKRARPL